MDNTGCLMPRIIVEVLREQARSHNGIEADSLLQDERRQAVQILRA
jgi:hypothetical protein